MVVYGSSELRGHVPIHRTACSVIVMAPGAPCSRLTMSIVMRKNQGFDPQATENRTISATSSFGRPISCLRPQVQL